MSVIVRGARNAFRNTVRTISITVILAISIGLALVMLLAYRSVQDRIEAVKSTVGNTLTVTPAGSQGFEGGGEPLTNDQMATIKALPGITNVNATISDRLTTGTNTSLSSAIDPGTLGNRRQRQNADAGGTSTDTNILPPQMGSSSATSTRTFVLPITITGVSDTSSVLNSSGATITTGSFFDPTQDVNEAVLGEALATKNNLAVGSTFTVYGISVTVKGIYSASNNQFANSELYMSLPAVQRLSSQTGQVTQATITVNSLGNMDSALTAVKNTLGTAADVTSNADSATEALSPLENISKISLYSLIGALLSGAVISLLAMIMIVRERRREIGVLKAIGASNFTVVSQFVTESMVLTLMGGAFGILFGVLFSNPILNALVSSSEGSTSSVAGPAGAVANVAGRGGFGRAIQISGLGNTREALENLHAAVGINLILYGLGAAILIAIIGSAVPAWLIAKVRPAEVMRGE